MAHDVDDGGTKVYLKMRPEKSPVALIEEYEIIYTRIELMLLGQSRDMSRDTDLCCYER